MLVLLDEQDMHVASYCCVWARCRLVAEGGIFEGVEQLCGLKFINNLQNLMFSPSLKQLIRSCDHSLCQHRSLHSTYQTLL